jgi:menaquinone-dependent protoporphyrinogen oxidase
VKISLIAATRHGSTLEVAQFIADRLESHGHETVCLEARDVDQIPDGDAVVLGSPLYMGRWLKPARQIAERLGRSEEQRPIFVFTCGPLGTPPEPEPPTPDTLVPALAWKAVMLEVFGGRLDLGALSGRERLVVRAVKASEGDFRDFTAIGDFAEAIAARLGDLDAPSSGIDAEAVA